MSAHRRARAAAAAMTEQGNVGPRLEAVNPAVRGEQAKFHKMIAAAASAKLRPGAILVLLCNRADRPIGIQNRMVAAFLEVCADAKTGLGLNGARESDLIS